MTDELRAVGNEGRGYASTTEGRAFSSQSATPGRRPAKQSRRRRFDAAYKLAILEEVEACTKPGEARAILRREGLHTSHLSAWRKRRREGALAALSGSQEAALKRENTALKRRLERVERELGRVRKVMEVQGDVAALLGELIGAGDSSGRAGP